MHFGLNLPHFRSRHGRANVTDRKTLRSDLKNSSVDCFFSSVTVGGGETLLPAFALALGASGTSSGLITAAPFMIGSLLQLAAPYGLARVGSYRRWVVMNCSAQALCLLPLAFLALASSSTVASVALALVYVFTTMYWIFGLSSASAWNGWFASLVPSRMRPKFFARRSHYGQSGLFFGMLFGGTLLHVANHNDFVLPAFAFLFVFAAISRMISVACLARQSENPMALESQRPLRLGKAFSGLFSISRGQGHLFRFLLLFSVSVNLASPFFNAFMLRELQLSYGLYMGLVLAAMLAKTGVLSALGRRRHNLRPESLMKAGLIGAALSPGLWVFSSNYAYLIIIQVICGAMWAVYELGVMLMLFAVVGDRERTSIMSVFSFTSSLTMLLGTSLGGSVLSILGESRTGYFVIFAISTVARLLTLIPCHRAVAKIQSEKSRDRRSTPRQAEPPPLERAG